MIYDRVAPGCLALAVMPIEMAFSGE